MLEFLHGIIKEICLEENIEYEIISKGWIMRLRKANKYAFVVGYKFSINSDTSSRITSDKYATYEVLKNVKLPVIEHKMLFNPKERKNYQSDFDSKKDLELYYKNNNKMLVVKPNDGHGGKGVYLCKTKGEIKKNVSKIFRKKESLSICPYYDIKTEYRVIILDGECKLIYGKEKSNHNWKCNLGQGASIVTDIDEKLKGKLVILAREASNAIGIRFASVDIVNTIKDELMIIEINSGVTIHKYAEFTEKGREKAKSIYKEAILKMLS